MTEPEVVHTFFVMMAGTDRDIHMYCEMGRRKLRCVWDNLVRECVVWIQNNSQDGKTGDDVG